MPKLPDATSLGGVDYAPARSFVNIPTPDTAGAFASLGRGLSDLGTGAQRYAQEMEQKLADEEAYGINLRLADAEVSFAKTTTGLDPSDPEFARKRAEAWKGTFGPILSNIQHSSNRKRFGEWGVNHAADMEVKTTTAVEKANVDKTKLDILSYIEKQKLLISEGRISADEGSANIRDQIAKAPYLFENEKQSLLLDDAAKFDESAADIVAARLIGNAREAPEEWKEYEGRLGSFLQAMEKAGFPLNISSHFRDEKHQAKLFAAKLAELRKAGHPNPEAEARRWVAAPGPNAPHLNGASDLTFNGIRLGDPGTEEAKTKAHELAAQFGLTFRMDHEPWHIEPVKDGSQPPAKADGLDTRLALLRADPIFRRLGPEAKIRVEQGFRTQWNARTEEDKLALAGLRLDMKSRTDADLTSILETGKPDESLTMEAVSAVMTPADAAAWEQKRRENTAIWEATGSYESLSDPEIVQSIDVLRDQLKAAEGTPDYGILGKVIDAAEKKQKELRAARRDDPSQAAFVNPIVRGAYEEYSKVRKTPPTEYASPDERNQAVTTSFGRYIAATEEAQIGFGRPRQSAAIVPNEVAQGVAKAFLDLPSTISTRDDKNQARDVLARLYSEMRGAYGDYTDEVIAYSLAKYKPFSRETSEMMVGLLSKAAKGKDIRPTAIEMAERMTDVDQNDDGLMGYFSDLFGAPEPTETADADIPLGSASDDPQLADEETSAR